MKNNSIKHPHDATKTTQPSIKILYPHDLVVHFNYNTFNFDNQNAMHRRKTTSHENPKNNENFA